MKQVDGSELQVDEVEVERRRQVGVLKHVDFEVGDWGEFAGGPGVMKGLWSEMLADGPKGLWVSPGSGGTWLDGSGYGRNGTAGSGFGYGGDGPWTRWGVVPGIFRGQVGVGHDAGLGSGSFTNEIWLKADYTPGGTVEDVFCVGNPDGGHQGRLIWDHTNASLRRTFRFQTSTGVKSIGFNYSLVGGEWYHLVMTYNQTMVRVYVNGEQTNSLSVSGGGALYGSNSGYGVLLGTAYSGMSGSWGFRGRIAMFGLYGTALSGARIGVHYQVGVNGP